MVFFGRFLEYAVTDGEVRKQDGTSVISSVGRNVIGRPIAWNFVRSRWNYIMKEYVIILGIRLKYTGLKYIVSRTLYLSMN